MKRYKLLYRTAKNIFILDFIKLSKNNNVIKFKKMLKYFFFFFMSVNNKHIYINFIIKHNNK